MIKIEKLKYYSKVKDCFCFGGSVFSEKGLISDKMITINRHLPESMKLTNNDYATFCKFYKLFRMWIVEKFFDERYDFDSSFREITSKYFKKNRKVKEYSDNELFFSRAIYEFISKEIGTSDQIEDIVIHDYEQYKYSGHYETISLTAEGVIISKVYLGALLNINEIINFEEWHIDALKEAIVNRRNEYFHH